MVEGALRRFSFELTPSVLVGLSSNLSLLPQYWSTFRQLTAVHSLCDVLVHVATGWRQLTMPHSQRNSSAWAGAGYGYRASDVLEIEPEEIALPEDSLYAAIEVIKRDFSLSFDEWERLLQLAYSADGNLQQAYDRYLVRRERRLRTGMSPASHSRARSQTDLFDLTDLAQMEVGSDDDRNPEPRVVYRQHQTRTGQSDELLRVLHAEIEAVASTTAGSSGAGGVSVSRLLGLSNDPGRLDIGRMVIEQEEAVRRERVQQVHAAQQMFGAIPEDHEDVDSRASSSSSSAHNSGDGDDEHADADDRHGNTATDSTGTSAVASAAPKTGVALSSSPVTSPLPSGGMMAAIGGRSPDRASAFKPTGSAAAAVATASIELSAPASLSGSSSPPTVGTVGARVGFTQPILAAAAAATTTETVSSVPAAPLEATRGVTSGDSVGASIGTSGAAAMMSSNYAAGAATATTITASTTDESPDTQGQGRFNSGGHGRPRAQSEWTEATDAIGVGDASLLSLCSEWLTCHVCYRSG